MAPYPFDPAVDVLLRHPETWLREYGTAAGNTSAIIGYSEVTVVGYELGSGAPVYSSAVAITSTFLDVEDYVPPVQQYALRLNILSTRRRSMRLLQEMREKRGCWMDPLLGPRSILPT